MSNYPEDGREMPNPLTDAFITDESGNGEYRVVLKFQTLTGMQAAHDYIAQHERIVAAKDARIAELKGVLAKALAFTEANTFGGTDALALIEEYHAAIAGQQQAEPKGCTKPGCFPYCDCGTIDDYIPPADTLPRMTARCRPTNSKPAR